MGIITKVFIMIAGVVALTISEAAEQDSAFSVGDAVISIPTPQGYYRIDGKNEKIDSVLRASVGSGMRLIVCYGSEVALAETLSGKMSSNQGMNFQAVIGTQLEKISISLERFKKLKAQISEDSKAFVRGLDKQQMEQTGSNAMSILCQKTIEMKVGEMAS